MRHESILQPWFQHLRKWSKIKACHSGNQGVKLHEMTFIVSKRCDSMGVAECVLSSGDDQYHYSMLLYMNCFPNFFHLCPCFCTKKGVYRWYHQTASWLSHFFNHRFPHFSLVPMIPVFPPVKFSSIILQHIKYSIFLPCNQVSDKYVFNSSKFCPFLEHKLLESTDSYIHSWVSYTHAV